MSARGIEGQTPSGNDPEIYGRGQRTDMTKQLRRSLGLTCTVRFIGSVTVLVVGLIFLAAPLPAQTLTTLHTFAGGTDGALGSNGVVRDANGNIYGTTGYGGDPNCNSSFNPPGCGTIYKLDSTGNETILHAFTGPPDGQLPTSPLLLSGSDLYGTSEGGADSNGTVFELRQTGQKIAQYSFKGGTDAATPFASVIQDARAIFSARDISVERIMRVPSSN
jgi:uncharacterized repeat protein (TIGR03803 family)